MSRPSTSRGATLVLPAVYLVAALSGLTAGGTQSRLAALLVTAVVLARVALRRQHRTSEVQV